MKLKEIKVGEKNDRTEKNIDCSDDNIIHRSIMGSSVNIAVPAMAEDFNMMPDELTWAVTAF